MPASIALQADLALSRVGVTITGAAGPALTVIRAHEDGTEWPVRDLDPFTPSGGAGFTWDYEAPRAQALTYRVQDVATAAVEDTATTRLPLDGAVLRSPGQPGDDVLDAELVEKAGLGARVSGAVAFVPYGASRPIMLDDVRSAPAGWQVRVRTRSHALAYVMQRLTNRRGVLLLDTPGSLNPWRYVHVASAEPAYEVPFRDPAFDPAVGADLEATRSSQHIVWTLSCRDVPRPAGPSFGDPTADYAALDAAHADYAEVLVTYDDYLDVRRGIAAPEV